MNEGDYVDLDWPVPMSARPSTGGLSRKRLNELRQFVYEGIKTVTV